MKAHIIRQIQGDNAYHVVDILYPDGRRERHRHDTRMEAERELGMIKRQIEIGGQVWLRLTARQQAEMMFVMGEAQEKDTSLREIWDHYKRSVHPKIVVKGKTLGEVIEETLAVASSRNLRPRYLNSLRYELGRFSKGQSSMLISMITVAEIEAFLSTIRGRNGAPASGHTILGIRNKLSAMFSEAVRKKYIKENPLESMLPPRRDAKRPVIFSPKEISDLLWVCRQTDPGFLAYLCIGIFAGVRPEEMEKLKWKDIHIESKELIIDGDVSKTRVPRNVPMDPLLIEWLNECPRSTFIVPFIELYAAALEKPGLDAKSITMLRNDISQKISRHRQRLCERAGVQWSQDAMRKTCASWQMQKHKNAAMVSEWLGNSPKVLRQFYVGLMRDESLAALLALTPANVPNDTIRLPKGSKMKGGGYRRKPGKLIPTDDLTKPQM